MGERLICAKYNRLVCSQLRDHSRRSRKTSYGASECTQGEEVEEGEAECNWMEEANELFKVIVKIPTVKRISGFEYCLR